MTDPPPESELVDFYKRQQLEDHQIESIVSSGDLIRQARRWRTIAIAASVGLLVTAGIATWRWNGPPAAAVPSDANRIEQVTENVSAPGPGISPAAVSSADPTVDPAPARRFRFVAFRSHDDRCPRCRATGQLFARCADEWQDRAIDFEEFELQKSDPSDQRSLRIEDLKLTSLVAGKPETGFALLLSPDGYPMERIDPLDRPEAAKQRVLDIIEQ